MAADYIGSLIADVGSRDLFHDLPMFHGVAPSTIDKLHDTGRPHLFSKGQIIYLQDDPGEFYFLVLSGWVKIFRETLEGDEAVIDVFNRGHIFGENSLFEDGVYSASAMSVDDTSVMMFPTNALRAALSNDGTVAMGMLNAMSDYRRGKTREIESLTLQSAAQRIGCFILRLLPALPEGESFTLHLPYDKSLIAARLGMKSETFSRALARLKKDANLQVRGASVTVPSLTELSNYCCSACSNEFPCGDLKYG